MKTILMTSFHQSHDLQRVKCNPSKCKGYPDPIFDGIIIQIDLVVIDAFRGADTGAPRRARFQ